MSEPKTVATTVEVLDEDLGVHWWSIADDRIGGNVSTAYALVRDEGTILVDPLPLAPEALEGLGEIQAILLTSASHQRSAWRLRAELEVPVWAPALSQGLEEEPDDRYGHSAVLPGDLVASHLPGAASDQHALVLEDFVGFVPDIFVRPPGGELSLAADELMENPRQARESVKLLIEQGLEILCLTHGIPLDEGVPAALEAALERAGEVADPDYVFVEPDEDEAPGEDEPAPEDKP
jgi:glyoxylase-like metal-dependent hydrolase (beta-lactamase superfamily II)